MTWLCRALAWLFDLARWLGGDAPAPQHILVLKPCCLGDVLMATPLLRTLREGYPDARITFAVGPWSRPALEGNPNINAFLDCGPVGSGPFRMRDYISLARRLRQGQFDLAIVLERSPVLGLLPFLAGIPRRVGLDSGGRGFAHTLRVPVDWSHPKHEAELYLDCARALGLPVVGRRLEFFPSAADRARAASLLDGLWPRVAEAATERAPRITVPTPDASQPHTRHPTPDTRYPLVAIHPGGAANPGMTLLAKRWPPKRFAAIADRLVETLGARIILVGAPSDAQAVDAVRQAMRHQPGVLVGKTTIGQLAAIYEHCSLMIGNDSGVMHLAVAVDTPVVAIFGPSDPRVYGPFTAQGIAVRKDADCARRCFAPGRSIAVRCDRRCIEAVTVDDVWNAVQGVLARRA